MQKTNRISLYNEFTNKATTANTVLKLEKLSNNLASKTLNIWIKWAYKLWLILNKKQSSKHYGKWGIPIWKTAKSLQISNFNCVLIWNGSANGICKKLIH